MPTAADANGIPRYIEADSGPGGKFADLLNLGLGWISAVLTPVGGTLKRAGDLVNGVTAAGNAAVFQSIASASGMTWSAAQPTRLSATKAGRYLVRAKAAIGTTANGTAWLRVNGVVASDTFKASTVNASGVAFVLLVDELVLAAGDYVELIVQSSATFTLFSQTELAVDRISTRV